MVFRSNYVIFIKSLLTRISPKLNVMLLYRYFFGKFPDLKNPRTLNEKIQWMKLYYYKDNELVKQCADKYAVRDYVKSVGLGHILNDLYGVYDSPEDINWATLPEKFVLKWNFGCAGNVICTDKLTLDTEKTVKDLQRFSKIKYHLISVEPQYDIEDKKIICEKFIEPEHGSLPEDYKFYCFNGDAKFVLCCVGRGEQESPDYYFFDRDWNWCQFLEKRAASKAGSTIPKPDGIDKLFDYAAELSKPFPFVRVDFYMEKGRVYFGELTFTPAGGFYNHYLPGKDEYIGGLINLPESK